MNQARNHPSGIALRIARFSAVVETAIESDEAKRNNGGGAHHPAEARGHEWLPVRRIHQERSIGNHEHHHSDFNNDDSAIGFGTFTNSVNKQNRDEKDDNKGRQIDGDGFAGDHRQRCRRKIRQRFTTMGKKVDRRGMIGHQPERKFQAGTGTELDEIA